MEAIHVTEENFETEVLQSEKPVLVDFWAEWCPPCKMLGPVMDDIAEENDEIKVCKVNIDEETGLATNYKVMQIPTIIAFKNGEIKKRSVGAQSKQAILSILD